MKINIIILMSILTVTFNPVFGHNCAGHSDENNKRGLFMGSAFRLGTELVAAVVVGTIIGFILDNWFDTKPWFIIAFFFIGVVAGILNVIRVANNMQK